MLLSTAGTADSRCKTSWHSCPKSKTHYFKKVKGQKLFLNYQCLCQYLKISCEKYKKDLPIKQYIYYVNDNRKHIIEVNSIIESWIPYLHIATKDTPIQFQIPTTWQKRRRKIKLKEVNLFLNILHNLHIFTPSGSAGKEL